MVVAAGRLYTLEEFRALPDEMTRGCELIDGRIVKKRNWHEEEQGMTRDMATHMRAIRLIWRPLDSAAEQCSVIPRNGGKCMIDKLVLSRPQT